MISGLFKLIGVNKMLDKQGADFEKLLKSYKEKQKKPLKAMSLCVYIRHEDIDVPLPEKLVLQSPGLQVPPSESQKAEMEKRKKPEARAVRQEYFKALR